MFNRNSKAQLSLQYIIVALILLVVASVIISIFTGRVQPSIFESREKQKIEMKNILGECNRLCTAYKVSLEDSDAAEYCLKQIKGVDLNKNGLVGKKDDRPVETPVGWKTCEDRAYCFTLMDCSSRTTKLHIGDCRETLCKVFEERWGKDQATQALIDKVKKGTCSLKRNKYNWYFWNFLRYNFCYENRQINLKCGFRKIGSKYTMRCGWDKCWIIDIKVEDKTTGNVLGRCEMTGPDKIRRNGCQFNGLPQTRILVKLQCGAFKIEKDCNLSGVGGSC